MMKIILRYLVLFVYFIGNAGFASEEAHIVQGEKGIEAFRQGNLILAIKLLGKSAAQGYVPAQTTLAYILDQAEENERAFKLFQQAAKKNYPAAQFGLGNMYAKGEGTDKNPALAGQWIRKAAIQHYVPAMRAYSFALESGSLAFDRNIKQAFQWYIQCSNAGDVVCTRRLIQAYNRGDLGQPVNKEKALELRRKLQLPLEEKK